MHNSLRSLLATSALFVTAFGAVCDSIFFQEAVKVGPSCGDTRQAWQCLEVEDSLKHEFVLKQCLLNAGCTAEQVDTFSAFLLTTCEVDIDREDLRKRDDSSSNDHPTKATSAPAKSNSKTTAAAASTTAGSTTANSDSTTAAASSTSAASTPSSTSAPSTTSQSSASSTDSTSSSSQTTTASAQSANAPLTCLTTDFITTTWCVSTTMGGSTGSSCFPTATPSVKCSEGLLCFENGGAATTCMRREDNLTTSGLVVTIFFGVVVAALLSALFWMCCRSRIADRRARKAREALLIAGSNKARQDSKTDLENRGGSEAYLPLMSVQGPAGFEHRREISNDYDMAGDVGQPQMHRIPSGSYRDVVSARAPSVPPKPYSNLGAVRSEEAPTLYDGGDYDDLGIGRQR